MLAGCLAVASMVPSDLYVFVVMLAGSWLTCIYLAYHHQGSILRRSLFGFGITALFAIVGYRRLVLSPSISLGAALVPVYKEGTNVHGLIWQSRFRATMVEMTNIADFPVTSLDLTIQTLSGSGDVIRGVVQMSSVPNVTVGAIAEMPRVRVRGADGHFYVIPFEDAPQAPFHDRYKIACPVLLNESALKFLVATTNVMTNGAPRQLRAYGSYGGGWTGSNVKFDRVLIVSQ